MSGFATGGKVVEIVTSSGRSVRHLNVIEMTLGDSPDKPGWMSVTLVESMPGDDGTISHFYRAVKSYYLVVPPTFDESGTMSDEGGVLATDGYQWSPAQRGFVPPAVALPPSLQESTSAQLGYLTALSRLVEFDDDNGRNSDGNEGR